MPDRRGRVIAQNRAPDSPPVERAVCDEGEDRHNEVAPRADPQHDARLNGRAVVRHESGDDHDLGHAPDSQFLTPSEEAPGVPDDLPDADRAEHDDMQSRANSREEEGEEKK